MGKKTKTVLRKNGEGDVVSRNDVNVKEETKKKAPDKIVSTGHGFEVIECGAKRGLAKYKKYNSFAALLSQEKENPILLKWNQKARTDAINEVNRISETLPEIAALRKLSKDAAPDTKIKIEAAIQKIINDVAAGTL